MGCTQFNLKGKISKYTVNDSYLCFSWNWSPLSLNVFKYPHSHNFETTLRDPSPKSSTFRHRVEDAMILGSAKWVPSSSSLNWPMSQKSHISVNMIVIPSFQIRCPCWTPCQVTSLSDTVWSLGPSTGSSPGSTSWGDLWSDLLIYLW